MRKSGEKCEGERLKNTINSDFLDLSSGLAPELSSSQHEKGNMNICSHNRNPPDAEIIYALQMAVKNCLQVAVLQYKKQISQGNFF